MLKKISICISTWNAISTKLLLLKDSFTSANQGCATTSTAKDDKIVL